MVSLMVVAVEQRRDRVGVVLGGCRRDELRRAAVRVCGERSPVGRPLRAGAPGVSRFTDALNAQIANEFAASQQYVAVAIHYDAQTLPQLAAHFYRQAVEERNHAMMMVQYLLDADQPAIAPAVEAPRTSFADDREPVALALTQEQKV